MSPARSPRTAHPQRGSAHPQRALARFLADRTGAVALEYGILAVMIVIALVGIVTLSTIADNLSNTFDQISATLGRS